MIPKSEIEDLIQERFSAILPAFPLVWAEQPDIAGGSAPRPTGPHGILKINTGLGRAGLQDEFRTPRAGSNSEQVSSVGDREFSLSVSFFGSIGADKLELLRNTLQLPDVAGTLIREGKIRFSVSAVVPNFLYQVFLGDETFTFNSGPAPTQASIVAGIIGALNAGLPAFDPDFLVTNPSAGEVEILLTGGREFTLAVSSNLLVLELVQGILLVCYDETNGTDLSEIIRDHWEKRIDCDFFFRCSSMMLDPSKTISSTQGGGTILPGNLPIDLGVTS